MAGLGAAAPPPRGLRRPSTDARLTPGSQGGSGSDRPPGASLFSLFIRPRLARNSFGAPRVNGQVARRPARGLSIFYKGGGHIAPQPSHSGAQGLLLSKINAKYSSVQTQQKKATQEKIGSYQSSVFSGTIMSLRRHSPQLHCVFASTTSR